MDKIAFRVDSSAVIGMGHVMRCLTLANKFREVGIESIFIIKQHSGCALNLIKQHNYPVSILKVDVVHNNNEIDCMVEYASWVGGSWLDDAKKTLLSIHGENIDLLIIDHYGLGEKWETYIKNYIPTVCVIDDLPKRKHACDYLIDQTLGRIRTDYNSLIPEHAHAFLGGKYAILRPEFRKYRSSGMSRRRYAKVKNIYVNVGGNDYIGATLQILKKLNNVRLSEGTIITVVIGSDSPGINKIKTYIKYMKYSVSLHIDPANVARLMSNSDLAIGAGGISTYERACLGLPTIVFTLSGNQKENAVSFRKKRAIIYPGTYQKFVNKISCNELSKLISNHKLMHSMRESAFRLIDGLGTTRILSEINLHI